tara:strand:- start:4069 stop:6825 length:2757 start_codon:yes stop_codon:yes gene_type:complete
MDEIIILLKPLVQSYNRRKIFKQKLAVMTTHILDTTLEKLLQIKKIYRIKRFLKMIEEVSFLPLRIHSKVLNYIDDYWKVMVKENGFINIDCTLNELNLDVKIDKVIHSNEQTFVRLIDYSVYKYNIKPLNCQVIMEKNKQANFNISPIRPGLPELDGKLYGLSVEIKQPTFSVRIFGLIDPDKLRIYRKQLPLYILYDDLKNKYNLSKDEVRPYVNSISYRDFLIYDVRQLTNRIKHFREKYNFYKNADYNLVFGEYDFLNEYMKVDFITFLLELKLIDLANYLFKQRSFPEKYLDLDLQSKINIYRSPSPQSQIDVEKLPYEFRISGMKADDKIKSKAYEKLKTVNGSSETAPKAQKYLDGILKIPFGTIKSELDLEDPGKKLYEDFIKLFPKKKNNYGNNYIKLFEELSEQKDTSEFCKTAITKILKAREKQQRYLEKVQEIFEKYVHGHDLVKTQLKRLLAQWISGGQSGIVLGLEGPPGNGKTTLIKSGLANCLVDHQGKPRPVGFIPLGGSSNASTLVGHGFTYQGSTWGRIVDILMDCQCMNPIILFDELDKVSKTENGREVSSILTHITDTTQNNEFYDKYFEGVPLDISKALMVFTFNDRSKIDPILLDRMTIIETKPLSISDKKIVTMKHLIPQITRLVDLEPHEIKIGDDELDSLICDYTFEAGARQLKKLLESLIQELNLRRLCNPDTQLVIDHFLIKEVFKHKNKVRRESITLEPIIGQINGMYANSYGLGGILPIQVEKSYTSKTLVLTGTQGDTMKESMRCAETIAINLVSKEIPDFNKEDMKGGLHIHCPSTGMPKDGPSAGGAICIAIYSFLCNKYINQNIAITGEIDLLGNILPIGGLEAKLVGAKKAGIRKALIPKDNKFDYDLLIQDGKNPEDDNFTVVIIETIYEALPYFLVKEKNE